VKLREHQAKAIFSRYGIPVPSGRVVSSAAEAEAAARELGGAVVLKPQLGVKGRGKVGGIGFADNPAGARVEAERLLAATIKGERVRELLVETRAQVQREFYLAVTVDMSARRPVLMASARGGVEIEAVARDEPEALLRVPASVLSPPTDQELSPVAEALGPEAAGMLGALHRVFVDHDAELVEVNPVAVTPGGLVALDGVLNLPDDALFRHPELQAMRDALPVDDPLAEEASHLRWTYIDLGGDIGILSSGAGLTMTIVDLITRAGGTAANFLDTAQIDEEGMVKAFELLARARPPRVWLVNLFAGLNRCDALARGIVRYVKEHPLSAPLVVRMVGNYEEEGHRILREAGIVPVLELEEAVQRCVDAAGGDA